MLDKEACTACVEDPGLDVFPEGAGRKEFGKGFTERDTALRRENFKGSSVGTCPMILSKL